MKGPSESIIQRAVVAHLQRRGVPGLFWFHVPNGGFRNGREAAMLKRAGVRPGVPDLILLHNGKTFGLELKAQGNRATESQLEAISQMEAAGAYAAVTVGLDRALGCLETWGLIR